jgi:hypothetical protein
MNQEDQSREQEKATLKKEILNDLKRDLLKKEILDELKPTDWKQRISELARHPLTLIVLGFALTGVIGAWLSSYSERTKWDYQQLRLSQIRNAEERFKQKNEIKEDVKNSVEISFTANNTMLDYLYPKETDNNLSKEPTTEHIAQWENGRKPRWEKLNQLNDIFARNFKDSNASQLFLDIMRMDSEADSIIRKILDWKKHPNKILESEIKDDMKRCVELVYKERDELRHLLDLMERELRTDQTDPFL